MHEKSSQFIDQVYMRLTPEQQEIHDEVYRHARSTSRRWGVPLEDLVQEGWVKALKIRRKYTAARGPWKAYLGFCLHQVMVTYAARARTVVKLPNASPPKALKNNPNLARTKSITAEEFDQADFGRAEELVYVGTMLEMSDRLFGEGTSACLRDHILHDTPVPKELQHKFRQGRKGRSYRKMHKKLH